MATWLGVKTKVCGMQPTTCSLCGCMADWGQEIVSLFQAAVCFEYDLSSPTLVTTTRAFTQLKIDSCNCNCVNKIVAIN